MTSKLLRVAIVLPLFFASFVTAGTQSPPSLPNPNLYMTGIEYFQTGGKQFIRYRYDVGNKEAYPADFFAASPDLPPCGKNTKAARTWVDVYDQSGKLLQGFCAFSKPADLSTVWFAIEEGTVAPSWVYIELNDRKTNTKYKSNLADTTM